MGLNRRTPDMLKGIVRTHRRRTKSGKVAQVRQHERRDRNATRRGTAIEQIKTVKLKSINEFDNKEEFLDYCYENTKKVPFPRIGMFTRRPYIAGYGCDGSTDANIHFIANLMCKQLGIDYEKIYEKAYPAEKGGASWIKRVQNDEVVKGKKVSGTTVIPSNTTIQNVLDDLYDINNRSLVAELEDVIEKLGISLETKLKDISQRRGRGKQKAKAGSSRKRA